MQDYPQPAYGGIAVKAAALTARIDIAKLLRQSGELMILILLCCAFIGGAAAGTALSSSEFSGAESVLSGDGGVYGYDSFAGLFFSCAKYHLFVLLLSTSIIGVFLIPAALAFRGFVLACTTAYIASAYPDQGAALTLVVLGLPSALTVPGLFIVGFDGACFSWRLLAQHLRRPTAPRYSRGENRLAAVAVMLILAAAVERFVVPQLVRLLI